MRIIREMDFWKVKGIRSGLRIFDFEEMILNKFILLGSAESVVAVF